MTSPYLDAPVLSLAERRAAIRRSIGDCDTFAADAPTPDLRAKFASMGTRLRAQLANLSED